MNDLSARVRFCSAVLVGWLLALASWIPALASEPCNPPNVIPQPVCDMDSFHGAPPREVPDGWTEFILSGDPTYMRDSDTYWGAPSLRIWSSGGTFKAGIYTQVNVEPGAGYRASIAWGAPNAPDTFGRQLGIDPTGGTDPNSPSVIWGPMHWGPGRILNYPPPDVNIDVRARALGNVMTVFFLVDHPTSTGDNLIFVDAVALYPDESAPAVEIPPTDTPTPEPVVEPAALPPTATPLPPTATTESTATLTPTSSPTMTPTETPSPTPSSTSTPTTTPSWTPWPAATAQQGGPDIRTASTDLIDSVRQVRPAALAVLGVLGFGAAALFGGSLFSLRRRR